MVSVSTSTTLPASRTPLPTHLELVEAEEVRLRGDGAGDLHDCVALRPQVDVPRAAVRGERALLPGVDPLWGVVIEAGGCQRHLTTSSMLSVITPINRPFARHLPGVDLQHELVEVHAALGAERAVVEKQVHQQRLARSHLPMDVHAAQDGRPWWWW